MTLLAAADLLFAGAAGSAIALGQRRADYRPVACFLGAGCAADWVRRVLALGPLAAPGPYTGLARVAFHLEEALFLAWPAGLAALATVLFLDRRPTGIALVYGAMLAVLVLGYPTIRGPLLRQGYLGAELVALLVATVATLVWVGRVTPAARGHVGHVGHVATAYLLGSEFAALFGAYFGGLFTTWDRAQIAHLVFYPVLICLQGGALWSMHQRSS